MDMTNYVQTLHIQLQYGMSTKLFQNESFTIHNVHVRQKIYHLTIDLALLLAYQYGYT
jgi:hypothetical protein